MDLPEFNYRSVYFFLMSLFGFILVISLTDIITVKQPAWISIGALICIFESLLVWVFDELLTKNFEYKPKWGGYKNTDFFTYHKVRAVAFIFLVFICFFTFSVSLSFQL